MALIDMYARRRARITADEVERMRRGYVLSTHYRAKGDQRAYIVNSRNTDNFGLVLEHNGEVLRVNQGPQEEEDTVPGFTLCRKCHEWLVGKNAADDHVYTSTEKGKCPRHAGPEDLVRGLLLTISLRSDLAIFDVPLPKALNEDQADSFYQTLAQTLLRALLIAYNLDEQEIGVFIAPAAAADASDDNRVLYRIVLYETTVGGSGVLAALAEPGRLATVRSRERGSCSTRTIPREDARRRVIPVCSASTINVITNSWIAR